MKSLGKKPAGARLERIQASPRWTGEQFRNLHPIAPGLRDPNASMPTLHDFLCGGERRVPRAPLPSVNPLGLWTRRPASGLRATWLGHSTVLIEIDGLHATPAGYTVLAQTFMNGIVSHIPVTSLRRVRR